MTSYGVLSDMSVYCAIDFSHQTATNMCTKQNPSEASPKQLAKIHAFDTLR